MSWVFAAKIEDIPARGARVLQIGGEAIGIFRTSKDEVFALRDACPHRAGPLSQGIVHGDCVTCPLHEWVISLRTGEATGPDEGATRTFPVNVEDGSVYVNVASLDCDAARTAGELTAVGQ